MVRTRRHFVATLMLAGLAARLRAAPGQLSTVIGNGTGGFADGQINNPYGLAFGPLGLYFCDLDNQRIRALDLGTGRVTTVAGNGERGHAGDGGPAVRAALNMPHEIQFDARGHMYIAERDSHVVRRVEAGTGTITTLAGTGVAGFAGDGGPAALAQLRQPHAIALDRRNGLLVCDIGNQRIRRIDLGTGIIETFAGTGAAQPMADAAPRAGSALQGPRTFAFAPDGTLFLALREGNAIYRLDERSDSWRHVAGTGRQGYAGDDGPAREALLGGPKGLAFDATRNALFVADTENHVIRRIDLGNGRITTVIGTGQRGDGPELDPLACRMARPHGVLVDPRTGDLYVADSEAHRIRVLRQTT